MRLFAQLVPFWNDGPDAALQFRFRAYEGGPGDGAWGSNIFGVARQVRLAIERVGDTFTVEYSFDGGATWQSPAGGTQGEVTIALPDVLLVGANVVSYHTSSRTTVHFDDFSLCPPGQTP